MCDNVLVSMYSNRNILSVKVCDKLPSLLLNSSEHYLRNYFVCFFVTVYKENDMVAINYRRKEKKQISVQAEAA